MRVTVTVAVLFINPTFVTNPLKAIGGILSQTRFPSSCVWKSQLPEESVEVEEGRTEPERNNPTIDGSGLVRRRQARKLSASLLYQE